jgi:hypothetical protein
MSRVEQIEAEIQRMSSEELALFRAWFAEFDAVSASRRIIVANYQPLSARTSAVGFAGSDLARRARLSKSFSIQLILTRHDPPIALPNSPICDIMNAQCR